MNQTDGGTSCSKPSSSRDVAAVTRSFTESTRILPSPWASNPCQEGEARKTPEARVIIKDLLGPSLSQLLKSPSRGFAPRTCWDLHGVPLIRGSIDLLSWTLACSAFGASASRRCTSQFLGRHTYIQHKHRQGCVSPLLIML